MKHTLVAINLQKNENSKNISPDTMQEQTIIVDEGKIFNFDSITSQIIFVINRFQKLLTIWTTTACDDNDDDDPIYIGKIIIDGKLCNQYGYFNAQGKLTSYHTAPVDSSLDGALCGHFIEPISLGSQSTADNQSKTFPSQTTEKFQSGSLINQSDTSSTNGQGETSIGSQNESTRNSEDIYQVTQSIQPISQQTPQQSLSNPTGLQKVDAAQAFQESQFRQHNLQSLNRAAQKFAQNQPTPAGQYINEHLPNDFHQYDFHQQYQIQRNLLDEYYALYIKNHPHEILMPRELDTLNSAYEQRCSAAISHAPKTEEPVQQPKKPSPANRREKLGDYLWGRTSKEQKYQQDLHAFKTQEKILEDQQKIKKQRDMEAQINAKNQSLSSIQPVIQQPPVKSSISILRIPDQPQTKIPPVTYHSTDIPHNPPIAHKSPSLGETIIETIVTTCIKDFMNGGLERRNHARKMEQEQADITHEKYVQQQKIEREQSRIAHEKYMHQQKFEQESTRKALKKYKQAKKVEIDFLNDHGYTYQPSQQDLVELIKNQLALESACNRYNALNTLSYDYLWSNKPAELKKIIQDSQAKINKVTHYIAQQRYEWDQKSLQEIANKEKSVKLQTEQAKFDRKKSAENNELLQPSSNASCKSNTHNVDINVDIKTLTPYIHQNDDFNPIQDSDHRYDIPKNVAQALRHNFIDRDHEYSNHVSTGDVAMIDSMLNAMTQAHNNATVECAQAGLRAWQNAQKAQTDGDRNFYRKKFQQCHASMNKQPQSIQKGANPVDKLELEIMLQNYNTTLELHKQQTNNSFINRCKTRHQAIIESQEQLNTNKLVASDFKMSSHARGYLMANNLNYAAFDSIVATNIQHCLTRENIELIEIAADIARRHGYTPQAQDLTKQICEQAITAQQLNQRSHIELATAITDVNYVTFDFAQSILEDEAELKGWIALGKGPCRVMYKWGQFLVKLGCDPIQTTKEMAHDVCAIGGALRNVASTAYDFSPFAAASDFIRDDMGFHPDPIINADGTMQPTTYVKQRCTKNEQTIQYITHATDILIKHIKENPLEDTLADLSEFASGAALDVYLTHKALKTASSLASKIGQNISLAGESMYDLLPPELMDEVITYAKTPSGELIAVSEQAGIDLGAAAVAKAITDKAERIEKIIESNAIKSEAFMEDVVAKGIRFDDLKIDALNKSIKPYCNMDKVLNPERLKTIGGVEQIEAYRRYTNNFSPEGLAKLKPEEILHLNLCDWLEPQAAKINARIKQVGGLKITELRNGIECVTEIHEFDLFHSLLGDLKPGSISAHTGGGHLFIHDLKTTLLEFGELENIGDGFFDLGIRYACKGQGNFKPKTYFPMGTTVEESFAVIEDTIKNPKILDFANINTTGRVAVSITNTLDYEFGLFIDKGIARFFPIKP